MRFETRKTIQVIFVIGVFLWGSSVQAAEATKDSNYSIRAGDKINIQVYREKELSGTFAVDVDGRMNYPLLGEIPVEGLSIDQLKELLTQDLEKDYLVSPKVQASFEESASKSITIFGQVQRSGNYLVSPHLTLLKLISQVGGFSVNASIKNVRIMRKAPGQDGKRLMEVDINDIVNGQREDVELLAGDIIFVDRLIDKIEKEEDFANSISVLGQIENPGNYHYTPELTLVRLISQAGGFTPFAAPNRVKIVRGFTKGPRQTLMVDASRIMNGKMEDMKLQAGDLIVVEESLF